MQTAAEKLQVIDDAIEQFEQRWHPDGGDLIQQTAEAAGLPSDSQLLAELIRVDIDRRYAAGRDVDLQDYFRRFPNISRDASHVAAICFEDYRVRRQRRKSCPPGRWAEFPAVESEAWFRELQSETQITTASGHVEFPSTASFISSQLLRGEAAFAPAAVPHSSERIGDFELVALLGEGAFSRVYLARQTSLGRRYVAAKVVNRPMQEPYNLSRLQHTGIVPLYSCHEAEGRWVLCMPYSGATTLARWLREVKSPEHRTGESLRNSVEAAQTRLTSRNESLPVGLNNPTADVVQSLKRWHQAASGPLLHLKSMNSSRLALWIFRRLASALAHAHQRGLVHGDLKPANILIRNDGEPALIDFNLSQSTESRQRVWVGGTMPYLAREQLQQLLTKSAGPPRPEYDIHALGVIMFEILEGRLPFRAAANTSAEELQAALNSHEQPPEFTTSNGSPGLRAIVSACLAPGPAGSYPTAVELLADIDREIANQPLKRTRESFVRGQLPKTLRRYPRAFSGGFITAAALMVIGLLGFWLVSARQEQLVARQEQLVAWQARHRLEASARVKKLLATSENLSASQFYARMDNSSVTATSDQLLLTILQAIDCQPGELFHEKWRELESLVSEAERIEARSCMIFLTLIAADTRVREALTRQRSDSVKDVTPESGSIGSLQIYSILSVLPESLQRSRLADCLLRPSSVSGDEASSLLLAMGDVPVSTSIGALDIILAAVRLANDGQDEESLRLLENTSPSASLATIHWMLRGQLQHRLGNFREATAAFSIILNEQPDFEPALLSRGISLLARGTKNEVKEAEVDFSRAIKNNPTLADAFIHRCFARQSVKDFDGALEDLAKALQLRPKSNRCFLIRARLYQKLNRTTEAESDLEQARLLPAESQEDRVARASALVAVDPKAALNELQTTEKLFGPQIPVLQSMAHVLSEHLQQQEQSLAALNRLLERRPNYQKALAGRAVLHARAGNAEASIADIRKLLETPPSLSGDLMFQVASAWSLCSKNQPELRTQAWKWLTRAVVAGYGTALLDTDPDLEPLRDDPEFATIRRTAWLLEGKKPARD